MNTWKRWLNRVISMLVTVSILMTSTGVAAAQSGGQPVATPQPPGGSAQGAGEMNYFVYLPIVMRDYEPPAAVEALILPGIGGEVGSPDGVVRATFSSDAVTQTARARYAPTERPAPPMGLAIGGQTFSLTARIVADNRPVTYFPYPVTIITDTSPWYSIYTPTVVISVRYTDADVWGLDLSVLSLYRREPDGSWLKVPTAVYRDRHLMVAETDTIGEFAPMSRLAVDAPSRRTRGATSATALSAQAAVTPTGEYKRLALDADDDVGHAYWPGLGEQREVVYSVRLVQETRARLERDRCRVDVLLTRESDSIRFLSRYTRAQMARDFGAEMFATLTFNALTGYPWGWQGDGGSLVWSGGDAADQALGNELLNRIAVLGRPHRWGGAHAVLPYSEFVALPGAYAHIEALYLDHNYDSIIIYNSENFGYLADAMYSALRAQLEAQGMYCGDDPNNPPPYPAPPSAELLKRWRDLGYQNYQRYGADPVSFSTGNHVVQVRLTRIPGRGGLDWDLTLIYNSQDMRDDLLGYGWAFPYNARAQRYLDDSVTVALPDGRTYYYTWNGSGYNAPAGVYERLEKTADGWRWVTPDETVLTFQETVGGLGILTAWRDRVGNTLHFTYDLSGQDDWQDGNAVPRPPLTEIRDDAGRVINVQTNGNSRITRLSLWDGRAYVFEYDGDGNLTRIADTAGTLRRFEYDGRHRMTKEWDAEGILFLQNVYDDRDRVVEQIDASGVHSYLGYDVANRITTFANNAGKTEVYRWDDLNRVTGEQDAGGAQVVNAYDGDYNLTARTDANGNTTRYEYDSRGNLIARYDPIPAGADYTEDMTRWTYNDRNLVTSMTNALGHTWQYEYDAVGNLVHVTNPDGSETWATYNAWGQPTSVTDGRGHTTTYTYDAYGNLTRTTYPDGSFSRSTYDAAGRETSFTDANGHTVWFIYDARDNITRITDPRGHPSTFEYDGNGLLTRSVDRRSGERLYQYDDDLKLTGERDPLGHWTYYGYDALYRRVAMTDTLGFVTRYAYDDAGHLIAVTAPNGGVTRYEYDNNGNTIAVIDALGARTTMVYDEANRLKFVIDALGHRTEYCYDAEDQLVRTIGPRGEVTDYTYDVMGRLVAVKDPLGNVTHYEYDADGNRTAAVDPLGHRTDYAFDAMDRMTAVAGPVLPGGERPTTRFGYDAVGNTTVITSPNGFATTMTYDENDSVLTITDPLGGVTRYVYDAEDNPIAVTDANGHTTYTGYNLAGLPISVTDPLGYVMLMEYDAAYHLTRQVNAEGQATTYAYDAAGQLVSQTDPLSHTTTYTRDLLGRVTALTDANGHTTQYGYDALGQLVRVTDALSGTTTYGYNEVGSLTVITDANGHVTTFDYNFLNQLKRETNPLHKSWWYYYDDAGRLTARIDGMWQATYYDYDSNDRLTRIHYGVSPETMHPVTFTYDLEGHETQMCDALGCTVNTYDPLGRPTTTTDWLGRTITRTYDAVGNLTGLTYPNGYQVIYGYNANDWLTTFTDPHGDSSTFAYNRIGQVTSAVHTNGTRADLTYDNAGRLLSLTNSGPGSAVLSAYEYALDAVGNRTRVVERRAHFDGTPGLVTLTHDYEYDPLDRLVRATTDNPASDTFYAFDAVGNRLGKVGTVLAPDPGVPQLPVAPRPEAVTYAYNEANQLTEVHEPGADTALEYNGNGDRIRETEVLTDGTTLITDYRYNREDQLVGVTKSVSDSVSITVTMVATYTYTGYGTRASKEVVEYTSPITVHVSRITYLYDGLDIIGASLEVSGTITETYYYPAPSPVTGLRRPLEMERLPNPATGFPGDRHWYQSDGLDSVVALTDESGALASPFLYDEYGQMLAGTTELQVFAYTGQDYDGETGLVHFYARYYDPSLGIWLTQDTWYGLITSPVTLNRYLYVVASPISYNDIDGHLFNFVAAAVGVVGGAVIGGAVSAVTQAITNRGKVDWAEVGASAVGGAVQGGICGVTAGLGCAVGGGAAGAAATSIASDLFHGRQVNWKNAGKQAVIGGATGLVTWGVGKAVSGIANKAKFGNTTVGKVNSYGSLGRIEGFQKHHVLPIGIADDLPGYASKYYRNAPAINMFSGNTHGGALRGTLHNYLTSSADDNLLNVTRLYRSLGFHDLERIALREAWRLGGSKSKIASYLLESTLTNSAIWINSLGNSLFGNRSSHNVYAMGALPDYSSIPKGLLASLAPGLNSKMWSIRLRELARHWGVPPSRVLSLVPHAYGFNGKAREW